MRKTNDELDEMIRRQQELLTDAAGKVDIHRGHVSKAYGQLIKNRDMAIRALESQKELTTINLRSRL